MTRHRNCEKPALMTIAMVQAVLPVDRAPKAVRQGGGGQQSRHRAVPTADSPIPALPGRLLWPRTDACY